MALRLSVYDSKTKDHLFTGTRQEIKHFLKARKYKVGDFYLQPVKPKINCPFTYYTPEGVIEDIPKRQGFLAKLFRK